MFKMCTITAWIGIVILILLGCSHQKHTFCQQPIYAAWEDGLTLSFEGTNPFKHDYYVNSRRHTTRVSKSLQAQSGLFVVKTFRSSVEYKKIKMICYNGGVLIQNNNSLNKTVLLPDGFPNRISRWKSNGLFNRVVGRAVVSLSGNNTEGIWVESIPINSVYRTRTLYVHNIGEFQTIIWDTTKKSWLPIMKLSDRTFTDTEI